MKRSFIMQYQSFIAASVAVSACVLVTAAGPVRAQATQASVRVLPLKADRVTAREVAARLTKETGVPVVVDRTVSELALTLDLPSGSLESTLEKIAAQLPKGSVYKKVMIPAATSPNASLPNGDAVAALAEAQETLYAPTVPFGAPKPKTPPAPVLAPSEVSILGKALPVEKATPAVTALDLRPVYLLTNPDVAADPVQKLNAAQSDMLRNWLNMSPEQQQKAAEQQIDNIINMDPSLRRELFSQQMKLVPQMIQRIQNLPEAQRTQFFKDITNGQWDGKGTPPGLGGGGANNGGRGN